MYMALTEVKVFSGTGVSSELVKIQSLWQWSVGMTDAAPCRKGWSGVVAYGTIAGPASSTSSDH